jgi:hypothetical protein
VTDATRDESVLIVARELSAIRCARRVNCAVGVAFHGDSRHGDDRMRGQPLFQIIVFSLAVSLADSPTVVVDRDGDVVRRPVSNNRTGELDNTPPDGVYKVIRRYALAQMSL